MENSPLMLQRGRAVTVDSSLSSPGRATPPLPPGVPKGKPHIVLIEADGTTTFTTLRKQALVSEMQLRHRDLRALEPGVALPYPSAIFVRKQALVLNLEGLKLIIGREKLLVLSVPSLSDLSTRNLPDLSSPVVVRLSSHIALRAPWPFTEPGNGGAGAMGPSASVASLEELHHMASLPFELRALEAALLLVAQVSEREVLALEDTTHPVLARIRRSVARVDLELIYDIRNRLAKTVARFSRLKELLEELLDDPMEMAGLCLSRPDRVASQDGAAGGSPTAGGASFRRDADAGGGKCDETALDLDSEEIAECEEIMEACWLQVDALLSRLHILQERIGNTEHLVNLDLDAKRNALVAYTLGIDLILMAFEFHMAVTSIFGMNLTSGLERYQPYSLWAIVGCGLALGVSLTVTVGLFAKRRNLLFLPSFGLSGS